MKLLIKKKSHNKFPTPYDGDGWTAIAVGTTINQFDPKKREAYVLENGSFVNVYQCVILEDLEKENN